MSKVAIIVDFRIKPGEHAAFDAHIREHAQRTLADEPGCERFDVCQPQRDGGGIDETRIMLFELYTDQAAFDAHRAGPRMPSVGQRGAPLLDGRTLSVCTLG